MSEPRPFDDKAFDMLLDAVLERDATAHQIELLNTLLRQDPRARARYIAYLDLHAVLADPAGPLSATYPNDLQDDRADIMSEVIDQALAERRRHDLEDEAGLQLSAQRAEEARNRRFELRRKALTANPQYKPLVIPTPLAWLAIAAIIGFAAALVIYFDQPAPNPSRPTTQTPETDMPITTHAAFIRSSVDARWVGSAYDRNHYLRNGNAVTLRAGLAEVVFGDGAAVIIQGPATFEPTGPNAIRLDTGRIVATVPASAHGFTVTTPAGRITDYGTEFGVHVNTDGQTLARAFTGRIGLAPNGGGEEVQLLAGDAFIAEPSGRVRPVEARELAFVDGQEFQARRDAGTSAYARWQAYSYELRRDPAVVAYYLFDRHDAERSALINHAQGGAATNGRLGNGAEIAQPRWVDGRFPETRALRFGQASGGRTYGVVVPDSDTLDLDAEMTFSLWVRAENPNRFYGTLLSKRDVPPRRMNYQVAIMPSWTAGGHELQFGAGRDDATVAGFVYSTASGRLSGGGWRHIVITTNGRTVQYYIDGEQVHAARQALPPLVNNAALLIGTSALGGGTSFFDSPVPFHGDISEILIANRAFDDAEIQALYGNSRGTP